MYNDIQTRVYELCTERGITIKELSEKTGIYHPVVARVAGLEMGKNKLSLETLQKIADGLGVPIWELIYTSSLGS